MQGTAVYEMIELIRATFNDMYAEKDQTVLAKVLGVNEDYTLNLAIIPDTTTTVASVINASKYIFSPGDYAIVYKICNQLANAFVIAKVNPKATEAIINGYQYAALTSTEGGIGVHVANVSPTSYDVSYTIGTIWINTDAGTIYFLNDLSNGVATWKRVLTTDDLQTAGVTYVNIIGESDITVTGGPVTSAGTFTVKHADVTCTPTTSSATLSPGGTFNAITSVVISQTGHVIQYNTATYTLPQSSGNASLIQVANYSDLPATGDQNNIYVTLRTGRTYVWNGTTYVCTGSDYNEVDVVNGGASNN